MVYSVLLSCLKVKRRYAIFEIPTQLMQKLTPISGWTKVREVVEPFNNSLQASVFYPVWQPKVQRKPRRLHKLPPRLTEYQTLGPIITAVLSFDEAAHNSRTAQEPQRTNETDTGQESCCVEQDLEEFCGTYRGLVAESKGIKTVTRDKNC